MFCRNIKTYGLFILLNLLVIPAFAESEPRKETETELKTEAKQKSPHIARTSFTSAIQNREPTDQLIVLSQLIGEVFFYTELKNYQGHTLTHQWSLNGVISHSVPFTVTGKRWRVYSSKTFKQGARQEGTWLVKVLDTDGSTIKEDRIDYLRPSTQAEIDNGVRVAQAAAEKEAQDISTGKAPVRTKYTNMVSEVKASDIKAEKNEAPAEENVSLSKDDSSEVKKTQASDESDTKTGATTSDKTAEKAKTTTSTSDSAKSPPSSEASTEEKDAQPDTTKTGGEEANADDSATKKPVWDKM